MCTTPYDNNEDVDYLMILSEIARRGGGLLLRLHEDDNYDTIDNDDNEDKNYLMISLDVAMII